MLPNMTNFIHEATGFNTISFLPLLHMLIRGIIVYFFGVTLARFNKKLLGIRTPFNFLLFVMLGSIFANAILTAENFIPTLCTILLLMLLNGLLTGLSYKFLFIEQFLKGSPSIIVKNGEIQFLAMKKNFITERELFNELHRQLHTHSLKEIETAELTSDGSISFIKKKKII